MAWSTLLAALVLAGCDAPAASPAALALAPTMASGAFLGAAAPTAQGASVTQPPAQGSTGPRHLTFRWCCTRVFATCRTWPINCSRPSRLAAPWRRTTPPAATGCGGWRFPPYPTTGVRRCRTPVGSSARCERCPPPTSSKSRTRWASTASTWPSVRHARLATRRSPRRWRLLPSPSRSSCHGAVAPRVVKAPVP